MAKPKGKSPRRPGSFVPGGYTAVPFPRVLTEAEDQRILSDWQERPVFKP